MQIGRVAAQATYYLVDDGYEQASDPLREKRRLDDLLVCLHTQYAAGEIDDVVVTIGDTRLPTDVVNEIFSALSIIERRT